MSQLNNSKPTTQDDGYTVELNQQYGLSRKTARQKNLKHFDRRKRRRHPKAVRYARAKSSYFVDEDMNSDGKYFGIHTNDLLMGLGFESEDVTLMELAYGNRLVTIGDPSQEIDFVKLAVREFFTDENLSKYNPKVRGRLRADFISYLSILGSTWDDLRTTAADVFMETENRIRLTEAATTIYNGITDILANPEVKIVDRRARIALEASTKLFERHVLGKYTDPLELRLEYGHSNATLADIMPKKRYNLLLT